MELGNCIQSEEINKSTIWKTYL